MFILYQILIQITAFLVRIVVLINKKLNQRENNANSQLLIMKDVIPKYKNIVWFHVASMGEFEQAKPIIENLKSQNQDIYIAVTFFSPSGYENQKNYKYADYIAYLPIDTIANAIDFLNCLNPNVAVFIRYDLWYNYLYQLKKRNIPVLLFNATLPNQNYFMSLYYKSIYSMLTEIYAVDKENEAIVSKILGKQVEILPDTRLDRINSVITNSTDKLPTVLKNVKKDRIILVAGSVWEADEIIIKEAFDQLDDAIRNKILLILTPHEPTMEHISKSREIFGKIDLLSELEDCKLNQYEGNILLVDRIGILLNLYSIANIAYVGGAFGVGVHSVAEPAGYGIPIIIGTNYHKSPDAGILVEKGGVVSISSPESITVLLEKIIKSNEMANQIGKINREYVESGRGASGIASSRIVQFLQ